MKYGWCMTKQCVGSGEKVVCPGKPFSGWHYREPCSCDCHKKEK